MMSGQLMIGVGKRVEPFCPSWGYLVAWLDGDAFDAEHMKLLGRHIPKCEECRQRLAFIGEIRELLSPRRPGSDVSRQRKRAGCS